MFEHSEDYEHFDLLLEKYGGVESNLGYFDFREPKQKRREFSNLRNLVYGRLRESFGDVCQLKLHQNCSKSADEVDHLIPLSSNVLNKELRKMKGWGGKKAPAQSFGSNNYLNFVLACRRCNAYKKHKIPDKKLIDRILGARTS